jgi:HEAT repeat protein
MSACSICGELPARAFADLEAGASLPEAAGKLEAIADGDARRCPECGAFFIYGYEYEYGPVGGGCENAWLDRVDKDRVVALLDSSAPSAAVVQALADLGVPDAGVMIEKRLLASLDAPNESHEALLKLMKVYYERDDWPAIERLLHHARPEVRSHTLYVLQRPGPGSWFQAARASNDPNPAVRARALDAARATKGRTVDPIVGAVTACLDDPDAGVRKYAAWTLAVYGESSRDISVAVPALRRLLAGDPSPDVRGVAKRALGAAKQLP